MTLAAVAVTDRDVRCWQRGAASGEAWYSDARLRRRLDSLFGHYAAWPREWQEDLYQEIALAAWQEGISSIWDRRLRSVTQKAGRQIARENQRVVFRGPAIWELDVEEALLDWELPQICAGAVASLPKRERDVITMRFGLDGSGGHTLEETARLLGRNVTRERIRQIEAKALRILRHPSRSNAMRDWLTGMTREDRRAKPVPQAERIPQKRRESWRHIGDVEAGEPSPVVTHAPPPTAEQLARELPPAWTPGWRTAVASAILRNESGDHWLRDPQYVYARDRYYRERARQ